MSGDASTPRVLSASTTFIASLDVGTTNVRCLVINSLGITVGKAYQKVKIYQPQPGWIEINPDELYKSVIEVIYTAIKNASISFNMITSLGISTQRATFLTWEKDTGHNLHNLITWQDKRAEQLVKDFNLSWRMTCFRYFCYIASAIPGMKKFNLACNFNLSCTHVSSRLLWVLSNIDKAKECLKNNNVMFGTLDTWLLYKLTNGRLHVTDISNASATGFFDLFNLSWGFLPSLLNIPRNILPLVVDNDYSFGKTSEQIFGYQVNIGCSMGDQMASMFGSASYKETDIKITIGTGGFINVNTLDDVHVCLKNMYPVIGWKINNKINYLLEIPCSNIGCLVNWLQETGLITSPNESSEMAFRVRDSNGILFFPDTELQLLNSDALFFGLHSSTTREHKVRAVLESIVYRIIVAYRLLLNERDKGYKFIRVDGGVSKNNFICQTIADLSNIPVKRFTTTEMSSMGVAYAAGLTCNIWRDEEEISCLLLEEKIFHPNSNVKYRAELNHYFVQWLKVYNRN